MTGSTDLTHVECEDYQELLSAYLDGEADPGAVRQLDMHLDECLACRNWLDRAARVTRLARLNLAEPWPDISEAVVKRLYSTN